MHDSQEFLATLVVALHESVNKAHNGRYMEIKDYMPGQSEEEYFQMTEEYLRSHDDSFIHSLMYGRLRTETICPKCSHPSLKFDPFNMLSLPLSSTVEPQTCYYLAEHKFYNLIKVSFAANSIEDLRILQTKMCSETGLNIAQDLVSFYQFNKRTKVWERLKDYKFNFQNYGNDLNIFLFLVHDMVEILQPDPKNIVQAFIDVKGVNPQHTFGLSRPVMVSKELPIKSVYQFVYNCLVDNEPTIMRNRSFEADFREGSKGFNGPFTLFIREQELAYSDRGNIYFKADEQILIDLKWEPLRNSQVLSRLPDKDQRIDLTNGNVNGLDLCFNLMAHPEKLDENNKWKCGRCKQEQRANIQLTLKVVPPILMLHLKRFKRDRELTKNSQKVKIPFEGLDLSPYVGVHDKSLPRAPLIYDLYGAVLHQGTLTKGHYTAMVKQKDAWYLCDDESVKPLRSVNESFIEDKAYILFYRQRPVTQIPRAPVSVLDSRIEINKSAIQVSTAEPQEEGAQAVRVNRYSLMNSAGKSSNSRF